MFAFPRKNKGVAQFSGGFSYLSRVSRDPSLNMFYIPICHLSRFALFGGHATSLISRESFFIVRSDERAAVYAL